MPLDSLNQSVVDKLNKTTSDLIEIDDDNACIRIKVGDTTLYHLIGECIGSGGFAAVHRSNQTIVIHEGKPALLQNNTQQVIKIQSFDEGEDLPGELLSKAIAEANHQWAQKVTVSKPIQVDRLVFTVIEDCGPDLSSLLNESPQLPFNERMQIALGLCSEMLLLKGNKLLHRDLKPENICCKKIERNGQSQYRITFVDFGFAIKEDVIERNDLVGSPIYMDPALLDSSQLHTYASDIYALAGIIGMLFGADIANNKLAAIERAEPEDPLRALTADYDFSELCKSIHPAVPETIRTPLQNLLTRMQKRIPAERPPIEKVLKRMMKLATNALVTPTHPPQHHKITTDFKARLLRLFSDAKNLYHKSNDKSSDTPPTHPSI